MSADSAHTNQWAIAEVIFGVPFLLGIAVAFVAPLPPPPAMVKQALVPAGIALILAGAVWIVLARRELARYRQPTDPGRPTAQLVTTGVFSLSRNPLYLGGAVLLGGVALVLQHLWAFAALPVSLVLCHFVLILPEEQYLAAKFGGEYKAYIASVHRWLGRK